MRNLTEKIKALEEGTKFDIPRISSRGLLYRVTERAIQINCVNNGMVWIPKSQICDIDETTGEILLSDWIESKICSKSKGSSGAY